MYWDLGSTNLASGGWQSSSVCFPVPPPLDDPPSQCGGNTDFIGACSPIVINLARGDYELTGANSPVLFDIAASGTPRLIGWTAAGADEAFLALDRDHNGTIDSGAELFGTATPLSDGRNAPNGFVALAELDTNHDGVIDSRDPIWSELLLWRDSNHNGISERDELQPIATSSVTAIGVDHHWLARRDRFGNVFKYEATVWVQTIPRPVYDIFFVPVR